MRQGRQVRISFHMSPWPTRRCAWWVTVMLHAVKQPLDGVCGVSQNVCVGLVIGLLFMAWWWWTVFPHAPPPPPPLAPHPPPAVPWAVTSEMGFWERMHGDPTTWPVAIEITGHVDTIIRYWDEFKLRVILPNAPVHVFAQVRPSSPSPLPNTWGKTHIIYAYPTSGVRGAGHGGECASV